MLVSCKAEKPKFALNLKRDFRLSDDQLLEVYTLPHKVLFEPYLKAFQCTWYYKWAASCEKGPDDIFCPFLVLSFFAHFIP